MENKVGKEEGMGGKAVKETAHFRKKFN